MVLMSPHASPLPMKTRHGFYYRSRLSTGRRARGDKHVGRKLVKLRLGEGVAGLSVVSWPISAYARKEVQPGARVPAFS